MSPFAYNTYMPQLVSGRRTGVYNKTSFSSRNPMALNLIPHDVLEQRARTPCKHFEHNIGWCPHGSECHFLHDYSRLGRSGSSSTSTPPSLALSTCSSLRSSPIPSCSYQAAFVPHAPAPPRLSREPRHKFTRTIGGTTYFPIHLGNARLGYVTPSGVEVFTNH